MTSKRLSNATPGGWPANSAASSWRWERLFAGQLNPYLPLHRRPMLIQAKTTFYREATRLGVPGRSKMTKEQLRAAIKSAKGG
jgi:hypothetical protein